MSNKSIIFIKGISEYNVLRFFVDDIAQSFYLLGYDIIILDGIDFKSYKEIYDKLVWLKSNKDILFVFLINGILLAEMCDEFKSLGLKFFAFFVDSPLYQFDRLKLADENFTVSFVSEEHISLFKIYINNNIKSVFIPHASPAVNNNELIPIEKRTIDILFTGTHINCRKIRESWNNYYSDSIKKLIDSIVILGMDFPDVPLFELGFRCFDELVRESEKVNILFKIEIIRQADRFLRSYWREKILRELSEFPIRFFVYGNGWENSFKGNKIFVNTQVDFFGVQRLMGNSKIVLDINPSFVGGGHERIFTSMGQGAVCLAIKNSYLTNVFSEDEIFLYEVKDKLFLGDKVLKLLNDINRLQEVAENGYKVVRDNHTWLHRAQSIINYEL